LGTGAGVGAWKRGRGRGCLNPLPIRPVAMSTLEMSAITIVSSCGLLNLPLIFIVMLGKVFSKVGFSIFT